MARKRGARPGTTALRELRILVVEDDKRCLSALLKLLNGMPEVTAVGVDTIAKGRRRLGERWHGLIVDQRLPDGKGTELLASHRKKGRFEPALLLTGYDDLEVLRTAHHVHARFFPKPAGKQVLESWIREVGVTWRQWSTTAVYWEVRARAEELGLSEVQAETLFLLALGFTRQDVAEDRGVSPHTVDTQCKRMADKADKSVRTLVREIRKAVHADPGLGLGGSPLGGVPRADLAS